MLDPKQLTAAIAMLALLAGCAGPKPDSPTTDPHGAPATGAAAEDIGARIDRYLSGMEALGLSGAIIVEHDGEVVLRKGYGLADRETGRPYTPTTVQTHGSITKQMTAAAILLLESRGAVSVDDPIGRYFEPVPEDKRGITLHHLLTHSSGLPGGLGRDDEPITSADFVELTMSVPLEFEPGSGYAYSNVGYSLLGIIVERVSGRDYETFLREELLLPAGLYDTGYTLPPWNDDPEARLAVGYDDGERWGVVHGRGWAQDGPGWHLRANGGLHTTVDDMHHWLAVLRGDGPLDADQVERWTTGHVSEGGDTDYAYGWVVGETEYGRIIAHNGGNGIFSADFVWLPDRQLFFYIHTNSSLVSAAWQGGSILAAAFRPETPSPPVLDATPDARPEDAAARAGTYIVDDGRITLTTDHVRLIAHPEGQAAWDLLLAPDPAKQAHLAGLNRRATEIMNRLRDRRPDAFEGQLPAGEDPEDRARPVLDRMNLLGAIRSFRVEGSIENVPGSRRAEIGPDTTIVRVEFEDWIQTWSFVWNEDGTFGGTTFGGAPEFVLVPASADRYTAVRNERPWDHVAVRFEDGCLVVGDQRACPVD